jgi:cell division initiation protein
MSRITPLDIRKKTFNKNPFLGSGYSKDDVDNFLQTLSEDFHETIDNNKKLYTELAVTKAELDRMRKLESELLQGLSDAKQVSQQLLTQSRKEADLTLHEAQITASKIIESAKQQARNMVQEANQQAYQALITMRAELKDLDHAYRVLEKQRDVLLQELRKFVSHTAQNIDNLEATRRTVTYLTEVARANDIMKKNNEVVIQKNSELTPTTTSHSSITNEKTKNELAKNEPIKNEFSPEFAKKDVPSFFDTI